MRHLFLSCLAAATLATGAARGVECPGALVGELTEGLVGAVALHANHLYVGSGATLVVYSLEDPTNPARTSGVQLRGLIADITVAGGYLYVALYDAGVEILDLAIPGAPAPLTRIPLPGLLSRDVAVSGNRAYVAAGRSLHIYDVSSPAAPVELGAWIDPYLSVYGVEILGDFALLAGGYFIDFNGLVILDVSNPAAPVLVSWAHFGPNALPHRIARSGSFVYLAIPNYLSGGLGIVEVSNQGYPVSASVSLSGVPVTDVAVEGARAYAATVDGLKILDLADPAHPVVMGSLPSALAARVAASADLAAGGGNATGSVPHRIELFDVSDPATPQPLWSETTPDEVNGVARSGNSAFLAAGTDGLRVVDISNPASPVEIARLDTSWASSVLVAGTRAYIADGSGGLRIADVSNPAQPAELGSLAMPGSPFKLAIFGSRLYVATQDVLRIVNVANPAAPVEIGAFDLGEQLHDLTAIGATVVLASYSGVTILDATNPASPTVIATYGTTSASAVAAHGPLLAAMVGSRLDLVDLSDPASPLVLGSRIVNGFFVAISMSATRVALADWTYGVRLFDISDPTLPIQIGSYDPPSSNDAVVVADDFVLSGNSVAGFSILSTSAMSACWLFSDGFERGDTSRWSSTMP